MDREQLLRRVGSLQQLAYIRPVTFEEGRAKGLRAYEVKNGPLSYRVLADKCLDVEEFCYKGVNLNFLSKPGLQGRNHYDTHGDEALRSIMGGLFFTAGLENICAPCTLNGKDYPMHGRIRTTPAEHISADGVWEGDQYVLRCSGEMREAELFGENLILRRTVETRLGERKITVTDTIENQGYRSEPLMLLYHINLGYPLLDEGTELVMATRKVTPRDETTAGHEDRWNLMDAPKDNEPEYVFIHDLRPTRRATARCLSSTTSWASASSWSLPGRTCPTSWSGNPPPPGTMFWAWSPPIPASTAGPAMRRRGRSTTWPPLPARPMSSPSLFWRARRSWRRPGNRRRRF